MLKRLIFIILLFTWVSAWAGEMQVKVVRLYKHEAANVIPVLRPLIVKGGTVTGIDDMIIIKTTAANLRDLSRVIDGLEHVPQQLLITLRYGKPSNMHGRQQIVSRSVSQKQRGVEQQVPVLDGDTGFIALQQQVQVFNSGSRTDARRNDQNQFDSYYQDMDSQMSVNPTSTTDEVIPEVVPEGESSKGAAQAGGQQQTSSDITVHTINNQADLQAQGDNASTSFGQADVTVDSQGQQNIGVGTDSLGASVAVAPVVGNVANASTNNNSNGGKNDVTTPANAIILGAEGGQTGLGIQALENTNSTTDIKQKSQGFSRNAASNSFMRRRQLSVRYKDLQSGYHISPKMIADDKVQVTVNQQTQNLKGDGSQTIVGETLHTTLIVPLGEWVLLRGTGANDQRARNNIMASTQADDPTLKDLYIRVEKIN